MAARNLDSNFGSGGTAVKPLERHLSGFSYDSERSVMVLFGGWNGYAPQYLWNDTWTWDGQNWTQQQPCDLPSPRNSVAMAYDPVRKRHVMFGGGGSGGPTNETWFYGVSLGSLPCGVAIAPITSANSTAPNGAGWNNFDVQVLLEATDGADGSGVSEITYSATGAQSIGQTTVSGASANFIITAEGVTTISYFASDNAGNAETAQILTVRIDRTAPGVSCGSPDGAWHASDVAIPCTADDSVSGLADSEDSSFDLTTSVAANTETANASTDSRTVCDVANNCATAGPVGGNKVDKKPPTVTITTPSAAVYLLNQSVAANYTCTDGGSGVATCSGPVASGSNIDTASAGARTFTVTAIDNVGNSATPQSVSYSVSYGIRTLFDQSRAAKSGSTIPIKIQLVDANGNNVSSPGVVLHAVSVMQTSSNASVVLDDAGQANPDFDFRYDPSLGGTGGYIFNLKTTGYTTGSYLLYFNVGGDPTSHSVQFQVRQ